MKKSNLIFRALICGFVCSVLLSFTGFSAQCGTLQNSVIRLHIIANSNSEADQAVKLLVRDAVLEQAEQWYTDADTFDEALSKICTHLESLENTANAVLQAAQMPYTAKATVCEMYFPTRTYETAKLPAGKYRTLRITLGEAVGKNWWCVVFPSICVSGAARIDTLPEGTQQIVEEPEKFEVKFKAAEIFSKLLEFFDA